MKYIQVLIENTTVTVFIQKIDCVITVIFEKINDKPKSRKTQFLEIQFLGMLNSRYFSGLSLLTSEINPENFRSISQRLAILQNNL